MGGWCGEGLKFVEDAIGGGLIREADVSPGAGAVGDDVGGRAAVDGADADDEALVGLGQSGDVEESLSEGVDGGDAGGEIAADVGGFSSNFEHELGGTRASDDETAVGQRGLEGEADVVLGGLVSQGAVGSVRAGLFVGVEEEGPGGGDADVVEGFERGEGDDDAALHVHAARAGGARGAWSDGEFAEGAGGRMDGVEVTGEQDSRSAGVVEA